jgi:hypothetical protein
LGATKNQGLADLDRAIALAPSSPDVRFIVSDAFTYGLSDPQRAFAEASLALQWSSVNLRCSGVRWCSMAQLEVQDV